MSFEIGANDLIAGIALLLSGYAVWITAWFNRRQLSLIESQERLNKLLLEQGSREALDALRADLGANFIKLGLGQHRLRIFNVGKAAARNVQVEFPDGYDPVMESDVSNKFPMEILERHQSVDLLAAVALGTRTKQKVR